MSELDFLHFLHNASKSLTPHDICALTEQYLLVYSDPKKLKELPVFEATLGTLEKDLQKSKVDFAKDHLADLGFKP